MASRALARPRTITRYISRRPRRRSRAKMTIPIAPMAGLAVGMAPVIEQITKWGNLEGAIKVLQKNYTPYDPWAKHFSLSGLKNGLFPLIGGIGVHYVVGQKMGFNRMLTRAGIPLLRL